MLPLSAIANYELLLINLFIIFYLLKLGRLMCDSEGMEGRFMFGLGRFAKCGLMLRTADMAHVISLLLVTHRLHLC